MAGSARHAVHNVDCGAPPSMTTLVRQKTAEEHEGALAQRAVLIKAGSTALSERACPECGTDPGSPNSGLRRRNTERAQERVHGDHDDPFAVYPQPRFPPAHTSATFEAVAVKKSMILTPAEIYAECAHHGEEKAAFGWLKLLMLSIIAGCYVCYGFTICLLVGGNLGLDIYRDRPGLFALVFGAFGFPAGFTMIIICGGELFTSMCAYSAAAWFERRISALTVLRLVTVTWFGNFAGCALFLGLMLAAGMFEGKEAYTLLLAQKKVHHDFGSALVRGIFANWLVGIATWQANAAQDMIGKAVAIWLPISAFAMLGFEHVIANQYLLPLAIAYGAPIDGYDVVVKNFIPATIGNWIGGAIFVAGVYSLIFGTPNRLVNEWCAARWAKISARRAPTLGTAAPAGGGSRRVVLSARGVGVAV